MKSKNSGVVFCTQCEKENESTSSFCNNCGSIIKKLRFNENNYKNINFENFNTDNCYSKDEISRFISVNKGFYLKKFNQINITGDKKTWNWSAFLATTYWLLYRKMYVQGAIYFIANLFLLCIPVIGWIISFCLWIGLGVFANSLYLDHINRKFKEINCADKSCREILINKKGGINTVIPIILLLIPIFLATISLFMYLLRLTSMSYYY